MNMQDNLVEGIVRLVTGAMDALDRLGFIARHMHPPESCLGIV